LLPVPQSQSFEGKEEKEKEEKNDGKTSKGGDS